MNYCIKWYNGQQEDVKLADEVILEWHKQTTLDDIEAFIKENPSVKVLFEIKEEMLVPAISALLDWKEITEKDILLKLPASTPENLLVGLYKKKIPYMFDVPAGTWDQLSNHCGMGASEVTVSNELGFELDEVRRYADRNGLRVRVYPNVVQASARINPYYGFWILPQEMQYLDGLVDTVDLSYDKQCQSFACEWYIEKQDWRGDVQEIILGFPSDYPSLDARRFVPGLLRERFDCKKKCVKAGRCHICDQNLRFMDNLLERHLVTRRG